MEATIVNKVAQSGIITLDLAPYLPEDTDIAVFDLKPFLFREMILREKDYRAALPEYDWTPFQGKHVAIVCSADAIIPLWAYMLAVTYLQPVAASVYSGTAEALKTQLITTGIQSIPAEEYRDKRVVIKGCGDRVIPESAYIAVTARLRPVVKSLMYGEPCSTVPVYKQPK
jgi:hypothetical protein